MTDVRIQWTLTCHRKTVEYQPDTHFLAVLVEGTDFWLTPGGRTPYHKNLLCVESAWTRHLKLYFHQKIFSFIFMFATYGWKNEIWITPRTKKMFGKYFYSSDARFSILVLWLLHFFALLVAVYYTDLFLKKYSSFLITEAMCKCIFGLRDQFLLDSIDVIKIFVSRWVMGISFLGLW